MTFLETVMTEFDRMQAASDGYEGVTHAGLAVVAADTGKCLLTLRALDDSDDPEVMETWEWPGGGLEDGEDPLTGAIREFGEETGLPMPEGKIVNGWRSANGVYQGFVYRIETEIPLDGWQMTDEVQEIGWFTPDEARSLDLRPEMRDMDWSLLDVSGNEEAEMADIPEKYAASVTEEYAGSTIDSETTAEEPDLTLLDLAMGPIPIHGVLAPEGAESGDSRGFLEGSMTRRPYRLPFMWQKAQTEQHNGAVVVGSLDRMMRKDGLIHWSGLLMPTADASEFAEMLAFFGRFGVSVDGDKANLDMASTKSTGVMWFDAVRAAGLTAVPIPAFAEAYVAFGPHPDMPEEGSAEFDVLAASGSIVAFDRGPGWATHPKETKRIHDYWTKPGQPGYAKIRWGTPGDFTRAKKLIGEKIGLNSPEDLRYLNQIIAQWHHDALGYWPGDWDKPGNDTTAEGRAKRRAAASINDGWAEVLTAAGWCDIAENLFLEGIEAGRIKEVGLREDGAILWTLDGEFDVADPKAKVEEVLTASVTTLHRPRLSYFHRPEGDFDALTITEPDEFGIRRTYGYAAQWGVCHIGLSGQCVEPPRTYSNDYPQFHLGRTKTDEGYINTGVLTYGVGHRDAETILNESAEQAYFDNVNHAWASVRVGEDEKGIWFSGVVLPGVPEDHIVKIEASGQVSGEWLRGDMRACLTVNVPGYAVERPSAVYDDEGNVIALAASAFGGVENAPCEPTHLDRFNALKKIDAEARFAALKKQMGA